MSDTTTGGGGDGMGGDFNDAAGEMPDPRSELNKTAQAQIDLRDDYEAEQRRHDQRLVAINHNLAAGDIYIPSYDLGPNAGRDLKADYEMLRTKWQNQGEAIDLTYTQDRQSIRENGVTPQAEFERQVSFKSEAIKDHRDSLIDHRTGLEDLAQEADASMRENTPDEDKLPEMEGRLEDWVEELGEIENDFESRDAGSAELIPPDVEHDLPMETREAIAESAGQDFWLEQHLDEVLDFSASDEFGQAVDGPDQGFDSRHLR